MLPLESETLITPQAMKDWVKLHGGDKQCQDNVDIYYRVCKEVGLNPSIAFVQYCHETGFNYKNGTGVLNASYCNPCGMKTTVGGACDKAASHIRFPNWETGIRAHVDHLALYAGCKGYPKAVTDDPRHFPYLLGTAKMISDLDGKWAVDPLYSKKLLKLYYEAADLWKKNKGFYNRPFIKGTGTFKK